MTKIKSTATASNVHKLPVAAGAIEPVEGWALNHSLGTLRFEPGSRLVLLSQVHDWLKDTLKLAGYEAREALCEKMPDDLSTCLFVVEGDQPAKHLRVISDADLADVEAASTNSPFANLDAFLSSSVPSHFLKAPIATALPTAVFSKPPEFLAAPYTGADSWDEFGRPHFGYRDEEPGRSALIRRILELEGFQSHYVRHLAVYFEVAHAAWGWGTVTSGADTQSECEPWSDRRIFEKQSELISKGVRTYNKEMQKMTGMESRAIRHAVKRHKKTLTPMGQAAKALAKAA